MPRPRSYIVRIYTRRSIHRVDGVVEIVANGVLVSFESADELWSIVGRAWTPPRTKPWPANRRESSNPTEKVRR